MTLRRALDENPKVYNTNLYIYKGQNVCVFSFICLIGYPKFFNRFQPNFTQLLLMALPGFDGAKN